MFMAQDVGPNLTGMGNNAHLHCPHCNTTGKVVSKKVKLKQGISGGKATGAIFTAGVSLLATGLSRKQEVTEMTCKKCGTSWHIA